MIGFNKDNNDKLIAFLSLCDFINAYPTQLIFSLSILIFIISSIFNLFNLIILRIIFSLLLGRLLKEIICALTIDRQYNVIYKQLKYPLVVHDIKVSKEDELANIGNENPKIPGIEFMYNIKHKSGDKFALAFQVDETRYKILNCIECPDVAKNKKAKVNQDVLADSFKGLRKEYIYSNECLILNIIRVKKDIKELDIVSLEDIDDTLIITENVYYPYIK